MWDDIGDDLVGLKTVGCPQYGECGMIWWYDDG